MKKWFLIASAIVAGTTLMNAQKLQENNVDAILKAMTLEEKATIVVGTSRQGSTGGNQTGNGMVGAHADLVPGAAGTTQPIPRLGIPASILTDGPAGVRINPTRNNDSQTYYCTGFPVGTALACTWNTELVELVGKAQLPEVDLSNEIITSQADESELAIITIGRQAGEGSDRKESNDFNLTDVEQHLISNVCNAFHMKNKKVVVILNMGNVLETASWKGKPDAILLAWQPGQEGGYSVADVLTGKANPSGKLTMTWPVSLVDVPSSANFPNVRNGKRIAGKQEFNDFTLHKEGLNVGYRYFNTVGKEVSYPFGYGMSYTTFAYSKPSVKATKDGFMAQITITNTGSTPGKEAVELYVSAPSGGLEKPTQELKSFAKTRELQPGESQTLTMKVTTYDLASYNEATQCWETAEGRYTVKFGASVEDIRATASFYQSKMQKVQCHDVLKPSMPLE